MIYTTSQTPTNYDAASAIDLARSNALAAEAKRLGMAPEPVDPDVGAREQIAELARRGAQSANVASCLLSVGNLPAVPLDPDLVAPSADPITTLSGIAEHWTANPTDGVGVPTGSLPDGRCLFALRGTPAALRGWLAEVADWNPVTHVLELGRQATVSGIPPSLEHTLPGILALFGLATVLGALVLVGLRRMGR